MSRKPVLFIILDGFGYRKDTQFNAIAQAHTPNLDSWFALYPHAILQASGTAVGLTPDSIGNSEVGHLTIGAGRVIEQPESFILRAIEDGSFFDNPVLHQNLEKLRISGKAVHIIGLLSNAGVHCHEKVIHAFIRAAANAGISKIYIHPILDGRDTPPRSAAIFLQRLEDVIASIPQARIGSLHGRFYAMDRDHNWDRTQKSYDVLTLSSERSQEYRRVLEQNYAAGITDEFIPPTNLDPEAIISSGDAVIFANYRPDRARQLTECFVDANFNAFAHPHLELSSFITPVSYGPDLHTAVMYPRENATGTLKEILSNAGKTIFTIAETEKYAHVTYFFGGGKEEKFPGETQVLIPSIKAKNYVNNPQMSAQEITETVLHSLRTNPCDFYLINYANADMVGHSGNFEATTKAIEVLDKELGKLFEVAVVQMHGTMFITADHGNAEDKFDEQSAQPRTAHTNNPVPFLMLDESKKNGAEKLPLHELADIMGFVLKWMKI